MPGKSLSNSNNSSAGAQHRPSSGRSFHSTKPAFGGSKPAFGSGKPSFGSSHPFHSSHASKPSFGGSGVQGDRPFRSGKPAFHSSKPSFSGSRSFHSGGYKGSSSSGYKGGSSRGGFSGNRGGGRGGHQKSFSDISKFVNKAVITEEVTIFKPEHAFKDFPIDEKLKNNIIKKGYKTPTPIQDKAIPHLLQGHDVVGVANTGTGKTAAFLVPLIDKILKDRNQKVLIMVPTRELATQIDDELRGFSSMLSIFSVVCVGGASIGKQLGGLRRTNNFVIGTPGRLKDLVERKALNLSQFSTVVLDEADRMLDMGFIHDMRFMISKLPAKRQTLFFSATMSREVEVLVKEFLKNPVSISVKTSDTAKSIDQDIVRVGSRNKVDVLHDLLSQADFSKVLIFGKTKHGVERLKEILVARGFRSESIHGNKSQPQRQKALDMFKAGHLKVLVATDVAARGIDVSDVSHVINYDLPATYEDYIHRIGRTGRAGKKGKAITFIE
jgi:superfamily II DNA/RNA helicase